MRAEPDGDRHIQLKLDPLFAPLLDKENKSLQAGNLVLEPICVGPITQADAIQPCQGLTNHVAIPNIGDLIAITGSYVHDIAPENGWMELHPVTLIEAKQQRPPAEFARPRQEEPAREDSAFLLAFAPEVKS